MGNREPCQVGNQAALSGPSRVPQGSRFRYGYTNVGVRSCYEPVFILGQPLKTTNRQDNESIFPILHNVSLEIHKVFRRLSLFVLKKYLLLPD